jgi:TRAP-type C4-dicarboxylate transport system permease large subunit
MVGLHLSANILVLFILAIFFILGFFIDILPMLLIGVPIFHPVAIAMGVDPIWFTVMFVIVIQAGVITPPFATILFALKGIFPDVPIGTIFKGVLPFAIATAACVILMLLIPPLVTWLPNLLY